MCILLISHLPRMFFLLQYYETPLYKATFLNQLEVVEFLTLKGADVNVRDNTVSMHVFVILGI